MLSRRKVLVLLSILSLLIVVLTMNYLRLSAVLVPVHSTIDGISDVDRTVTEVRKDTATSVTTEVTPAITKVTEVTPAITKVTEVTPAITKVSQLPWTSLNDGKDKQTNFCSAYYDGRKGAPGRPAVIVIGYNLKSAKLGYIHCVFTFANRTSVCLVEPAIEDRSCIDIHNREKNGSAFIYICRIKCKAADCTDEEIPTSVALSKYSDCASPSGQIPVYNRQIPRIKKTFGVCVQSPTFGEAIGVQQISEFIEMNRALGAEIITLYVMEMKEDVLRFLLDHYAKQGLLQLVRWRKLKKWDPLHYHGQIVSLHDCLYRNMQKVKYVAVVDLDEVFLPLKHQNWHELINAIGNEDRYHSYKFANCFYQKNNAEIPKTTVPCERVKVPKYFQWTSQIMCYCNIQYYYRTKVMVRTDRVLGMGVHTVCKAITGTHCHVPHALGLNAHYRPVLPPGECTDRRSTPDTTMLKYQSRVLEAMGQQMCSQNSLTV